MPREVRPPQTNLNPDDILTTHEVAHYIKMNPSSVNKWITEGYIQAFRTPGGHRRIKVSDLHSFLIVHKMPVPFAIEFAMVAAAPEPPKADMQPAASAARRNKAKHKVKR